jgi:hypothetical protein
MNAGDPTRDVAIMTDQIALTVNFPQPKLFIINPQDQADLNLLQQLFPLGTVSNYISKVGKDFYIYMVPKASSSPGAVPASGGRVIP